MRFLLIMPKFRLVTDAEHNEISHEDETLHLHDRQNIQKIETLPNWTVLKHATLL